MLNLGQFAASIVKRQGDVQYLVGGLLARAVERYSACGRRHVRRRSESAKSDDTPLRLPRPHERRCVSGRDDELDTAAEARDAVGG